jgi:hypothetical protein
MGLTVRGSKPDGVKFSFTIPIGPGAHPSSYSRGTGSSLRVKESERGLDHPSKSIAEVKERVELHFYSTSGPSWPLLGGTLR